MFNLADMYHHGRHVTWNIPEAIRLHKFAAIRDIEEAFFEFYEIYRHGGGAMRANLACAVQAGKLWADRGHMRGVIQYAELLEEGAAVARDHAKGAKLIAKVTALALRMIKVIMASFYRMQGQSRAMSKGSKILENRIGEWKHGRDAQCWLLLRESHWRREKLGRSRETVQAQCRHRSSCCMRRLSTPTVNGFGH
jgi:hypothetical protein